MEHLDLHKIFQTLLPIAIFVIWAMFSRAGNRKREGASPKPRDEHYGQKGDSRTAQEEQRESQTQKPGSSVSWKRSLDTLLGEMGLPVEHEEPPPKRIETTLEKPAAPEPKATPKKTVDKQMKSHLAIQESAYTLAASPIDDQKAYSTITESIPVAASQTLHAISFSGYTADELKRFVVWAEVLGRPVGLREGKHLF